MKNRQAPSKEWCRYIIVIHLFSEWVTELSKFLMATENIKVVVHWKMKLAWNLFTALPLYLLIFLTYLVWLRSIWNKYLYYFWVEKIIWGKIVRATPSDAQGPIPAMLKGFAFLRWHLIYEARYMGQLHDRQVSYHLYYDTRPYSEIGISMHIIFMISFIQCVNEPVDKWIFNSFELSHHSKITLPAKIWLPLIFPLALFLPERSKHVCLVPKSKSWSDRAKYKQMFGRI